MSDDTGDYLTPETVTPSALLSVRARESGEILDVDEKAIAEADLTHDWLFALVRGRAGDVKLPGIKTRIPEVKTRNPAASPRGSVGRYQQGGASGFGQFQRLSVEAEAVGLIGEVKETHISSCLDTVENFDSVRACIGDVADSAQRAPC